MHVVRRYVRTYVRTYVCTDARMCGCTYVRMCVRIYVRAHVRMYVCMYVYTYVRMYVRINVHPHTTRICCTYMWITMTMLMMKGLHLSGRHPQLQQTLLVAPALWASCDIMARIMTRSTTPNRLLCLPPVRLVEKALLYRAGFLGFQRAQQNPLASPAKQGGSPGSNKAFDI